MKIKKTIIILIIFVIFICSVSYTVSQNIGNDVPTKDAGENLLMAYNLQKYGTLSLDTDDSENPEPTAFREPVFPLYLSFCIWINPTTRDLNRAELFEQGVKYIRFMQIPILLIISFLAFYIVYRITKNLASSFFALFLVGSSIALQDTINRLLTEDFSALIIIINSILLYLLVTKKKLIYFILFGISLGILILDKAIFLYFLFFIVIFLVIYYLKSKFLSLKKFITGLMVMLLLSSSMVCGWMFRNYHYFNTFSLAGRSGNVLLLRAEKNNMTSKEYIASFFYWAPGDLVKTKIMPKIFDESDYKRLVRTNKDSFYYNVTRIEWGAKNIEDTNTISSESTSFEKDKELRDLAIKKILNNPVRHILAIPQFMWRGIFAESGFRISIPSTDVQVVNNNILNLFLFFCFIYLFVISIKRKYFNLFAFLMPSMYLFLMYSFFTHYIPRYSIPLIPILIVSSVILISNKFYKSKK